MAGPFERNTRKGDLGFRKPTPYGGRNINFANKAKPVSYESRSINFNGCGSEQKPTINSFPPSKSRKINFTE